MRSTALPRTPADLRAEREVQLKAFMEAGLSGSDTTTPASVLVLARSPHSQVFQSVFSRTAELTARGIEARVVLLSGEAGERWNVEFAPGFRHEIRLAEDHRLVDAHEQLVVGAGCVWFGDSMRRDADRRDAFARAIRDDVVTARGARWAFQQLWTRCRSIYRNTIEQSVREDTEMDVTTSKAALAQDALATLGVWQPSSRH